MTSGTSAYRWLAWGAMAAVAVVVFATFRDYGITWDEEWQNVYGKKLLEYYLSGFVDRSAFSYSNLYLYGGLFDLVAAALNHISPIGEYETRHLLGGLVGVVGLIGCWRLARLLAGERAAFLAVVLITLTPSLYGHMFNNPKDTPFAWGMIWTTYYLCRVLQEFPKPSRGSLIGFSLTLGLTVATRVGGLVIVPYLGAGVALHFALKLRDGVTWREALIEVAAGSLRLVPALIGAYVLMGLFWPWSVQEPLNPVRALLAFNDIGWKGSVLIDGHSYLGTQEPFYYLPLMLAIKLPELVLCGLAAWIFARGLGRDRPTILWFSTVTLSAVFPIVYTMVARPVDFDGIRHFLFVVPPIAILAAIGLDRRVQKLQTIAPAAGHAGLAAIAGLASWMLVTAHELHPDEYVYFNSLVGGTGGADGQYELDYWGNSLAEAAHKLDAFVRGENGGKPYGGIYRTTICGYPLSALHYLPSYIHWTTNPSEADFSISLTQSYCAKDTGGHPIIRVKRDGATLSIVTDRRHVLRSVRR